MVCFFIGRQKGKEASGFPLKCLCSRDHLKFLYDPQDEQTLPPIHKQNRETRASHPSEMSTQPESTGAEAVGSTGERKTPMKEANHLTINSSYLAGLDDHPSVKRLLDNGHNVLSHHRVTLGPGAWHVITRRLLDVDLPEADNAWSYETGIFPERTANQPDLAQGRYIRYGTQMAATAGHAHAIRRLLQQQALEQ